MIISRNIIYFFIFLTEHARKFWVKPMIDELLKNSDCNVIFVDWENGASYPFNQAFGDARVVGM